MPEIDRLNAAIVAAHLALEQDPEGRLHLGHRRAIWAALGPRMESPGVPTAGTWRRFALARLSVLQVLPRWYDLWPDDNTPERLVAAAEATLAGSLDRDALDDLASTTWQRFFALGADDPAVYARACVGFAAIAAAHTALRDEYFDPRHLDTSVRDSAVDPEWQDAGYFAATTAAGGGPLAPAADHRVRRAFWIWWLDEAVPSAAQTEPGLQAIPDLSTV